MNRNGTSVRSIRGALSRPVGAWSRRRALILLLALASVVGCGGGSATAGATAGATARPAATPAPTPTAAPTIAPTATPTAPMATVTFNDMMLDAQSGLEARPRTFIFTSDGAGAVSIAIVKNQVASDTTSLCVTMDGGAPTCQSSQMPTFTAQATTAHSTWTVEAISAGPLVTPVVDISIIWPTNNASITLNHGSLRGSSSPGVPEALNGFNVTFQPRGAGNLTVLAGWTVILTYIDVTLADVTNMPWVSVDEQQYQGGGKGINKTDPPYTHAVSPAKTYRFSLRNLAADNYRPDLQAQIAFP